MERWTPDTMEVAQKAIDDVAQHAGPDVYASYARKLIDPYPASIERFGEVEHAFVVAKMLLRVVFFDDVEEDFGTATEIDGRLVDCAMYGDLRLAIKEAEAGA